MSELRTQIDRTDKLMKRANRATNEKCTGGRRMQGNEIKGNEDLCDL